MNLSQALSTLRSYRGQVAYGRKWPGEPDDGWKVAEALADVVENRPLPANAARARIRELEREVLRLETELEEAQDDGARWERRSIIAWIRVRAEGPSGPCPILRATADALEPRTDK